MIALDRADRGRYGLGRPDGDGLGVPFTVSGVDRSRSRGRDRTFQRWSGGRPRSADGPWPDDPSLLSGRNRETGSGRHAWARVGSAHTSSQRSGSGVAPPKGRSVDPAVLTRPTTACPKACRRRAVLDDIRSPPRRGSGDRRGRCTGRRILIPRGCANTIPKEGGPPRVLVRVTQSDRSIRGPGGAGPKPCGTRKRTGRTSDRNAKVLGIAETNPGDHRVLSDPCVGRC